MLKLCLCLRAEAKKLVLWGILYLMCSRTLKLIDTGANKLYECWVIFKKWKTQREQKLLTLSWRVPLSYRNQSIDLLCKSMDWFLYDNSPRHERVNWYPRVKPQVVKSNQIKNHFNKIGNALCVAYHRLIFQWHLAFSPLPAQYCLNINMSPYYQHLLTYGTGYSLWKQAKSWQKNSFRKRCK